MVWVVAVQSEVGGANNSMRVGFLFLVGFYFVGFLFSVFFQSEKKALVDASRTTHLRFKVTGMAKVVPVPITPKETEN